MKTLPFNFFFLILSVSISSCTYQNTDINSEKDNADGKAFLRRFYKLISADDSVALNASMSDELRKVAGPYGISKLVHFVQRKVGYYERYSITDHYIESTKGTINEVHYSYKLNVYYQKALIVESIDLIKQNDQEIKLHAYHANSDLLME